MALVPPLKRTTGLKLILESKLFWKVGWLAAVACVTLLEKALRSLQSCSAVLSVVVEVPISARTHRAWPGTPPGDFSGAPNVKYRSVAVNSAEDRVMVPS